MRKIKSALGFASAILILVLISKMLYIYVQTATMGEIISQAAFYGFLLIFPLLIKMLITKIPVMGVLIQRLDSAVHPFFSFLLILLFAFGLPWMISGIYFDEPRKLPIWNLILILSLWGVCLIAAIWAILFEKNRIRLFSWLGQRVGIYAPLVYSFGVMWIGIYFFSSFTYTLIRFDILHWIDHNNQNITLVTLSSFYFWHFMDAMPVFKITNTLLWNQPLTYDSHQIGLLLLSFKIIVISPIIGAFVWSWRFLGQGKKEETTKIRIQKRVPRTYHRKHQVLH
jgi:hypothetical protein